MRRYVQASVVILGLWLGAHSASALGVTPPHVVMPSVLRDTRQTRYVTLSRNDAVGDLTLKPIITSTVTGAIEIEPVIEMPEGVDSLRVPIKINAANLENGGYSASIRFVEVPEENAEVTAEPLSVIVNIGVLTSAEAQIDFTVTDIPLVEYVVHNIQLTSVEVDDPVRIEWTVENTGNVPSKPTQARFAIQDRFDAEVTESVEIASAEIDLVPPGEERTMVFYKDVDLPIGTYDVRALFSDDATEFTVVGESQGFCVFPQDTLSQKGEMLSLQSSTSSAMTYENVTISAEFNNIGEAIDALLVLELYNGDRLLDIYTSKSLRVDGATDSLLSRTFSVASAGEYAVTAHVEYGNKKTPNQTIYIHITPNTFVQSTQGWVMVGLLATVSILMAVLVKKRSRARKRGVKSKSI